MAESAEEQTLAVVWVVQYSKGGFVALFKRWMWCARNVRYTITACAQVTSPLHTHAIRNNACQLDPEARWN